jgi:tagaturonate epimerase
MQIEKFSFGTGDRFGKEGMAQLSAIQEINRLGIPVVPVWNKSNREHAIIHSMPASVKAEAEAAVAEGRYAGMYYTDADHINLETVDRFVDSCNFFTIDVAHFIGMKASGDAVADFVTRYRQYLGSMRIPGIAQKLDVTVDFLTNHAENYLTALEEVKKIYDHICAIRGESGFITEVSVDEADYVQGPLELFFILAELKEKGIKVQTIAPKFSGLFAKGVDYIGDVDGFAREFEQDVAVVTYAGKELGLPGSLKLSVHSGSDKFSIYPAIRAAIQKFDAGIHVKTAGTTWLEEVNGLAEAGSEGLEIAKEIYARSCDRYDELTGPYATVLNINRQRLPGVAEVKSWNGRQFSEALTHDQACKSYNPHFRQLIHVGYKIAAEMGGHFLEALDKHHEVIAGKVKFNLLERHLKPLFI